MKLRNALILLLTVGSSTHLRAFTFHSNKILLPSLSPSNTNGGTKLLARGKGSLRKNLDIDSLDDIPDTKAKRMKPTKKGSGKSKTTKTSGTISPSLAQWAASNKSSSSDEREEVLEKVAEDQDSVAEFTSFKKIKKGKKQNKSERRTRQAQRQKEEKQIRQKTQKIISDLEELLDVDSTRDIDSILGKIRDLTAMNQGKEESVISSMKTLCAGQKRRDYRMIWAGSDDAICHLGTGLHKVPLARLQEIFMTLGKSRIEMYEVIRILGPFPNVKNTLKGDVMTLKPENTSKSTLRVSYDSMIDGTGKEILSGKEENVRTVELKTRFASEDIIICQTPTSSEEENANTYEDEFGLNGSNLLVFALEEDMDVKMEALRVG